MSLCLRLNDCEGLLRPCHSDVEHSLFVIRIQFVVRIRCQVRDQHNMVSLSSFHSVNRRDYDSWIGIKTLPISETGAIILTLARRNLQHIHPRQWLQAPSNSILEQYVFLWLEIS